MFNIKKDEPSNTILIISIIISIILIFIGLFLIFVYKINIFLMLIYFITISGTISPTFTYALKRIRNKGKLSPNEQKLDNRLNLENSSEQTNKISKLICASCKSIIEEDYAYCMNCGASLA